MSLGDNHLATVTGWELPPQRVAAGWERLTAIAKAAKAAGDDRRVDQLRADALLDLLVGDGVAAGGPVTRGDLDSLPSDPPAVRPPEAADVPWPRAPADPQLLEDPEPAPPATGPAEPLPLAAEPPDDVDGAEVADAGLLRLRRFWLAGFDRLPTVRPAGIPPEPGTMPGPRRGVIDLQLPLSTLMGLDDLPGELSGFGPLLADIARQTVDQNPQLQWRFSVYNDTGSLISHGITHAPPTTSGVDPPEGRRTSRRPSVEVAAHVRARNRTCFAPTCRRSSAGCELDHTIAWSEGGESEPGNLGPGCTRHHQLKHAAGSDLIQLSPGVFGWTTPRGMQYVTHPDPPLYEDG